MALLTRPTTLPVWAIDDQIDPVSLQNNVLTPPPAFQLYGWTRGQFPPRNWFNWLGRFTFQCIAYLMQQEAFGFTTDDNSSATPVVDIVNGGMAIISVIDTTTPANYYLGITYVPPNYSSGLLSFTTTSSSTLTVSAIAANGGVTVSGGSGNYIINVEMKEVLP